MSLRFDRLLHHTHAGEPWYGPSRTKALAGLTAREAAARPVPGAHTIWELVLHMTAWTHEVRRRLAGAPAGEPPEGDWPAVGEASDARWAAARADLDRAHGALLAVVEGLSEEDLARRVAAGDPAAGGGVRMAAMLAGMAQHDAYHTGQIMLLRRALASGYVGRPEVGASSGADDSERESAGDLH